jgi:hypothetical protein
MRYGINPIIKNKNSAAATIMKDQRFLSIRITMQVRARISKSIRENSEGLKGGVSSSVIRYKILFKQSQRKNTGSASFTARK